MATMFNFSVTEEFGNVILASLQKAPYEVSAPVIAELLKQAQGQNQSVPTPEEVSNMVPDSVTQD